MLRCGKDGMMSKYVFHEGTKYVFVGTWRAGNFFATKKAVRAIFKAAKTFLCRKLLEKKGKF